MPHFSKQEKIVIKQIASLKKNEILAEKITHIKHEEIYHSASLNEPFYKCIIFLAATPPIRSRSDFLFSPFPPKPLLLFCSPHHSIYLQPFDSVFFLFFFFQAVNGIVRRAFNGRGAAPARSTHPVTSQEARPQLSLPRPRPRSRAVPGGAVHLPRPGECFWREI